MIFKLNNYNLTIDFEAAHIWTMEILNKKLFTNLIISLQSEAGEDGLIPYQLWDGDKRLAPKNKFLLIDTLPILPTQSKSFETRLIRYLTELLSDDELFMNEFDRLSKDMAEAMDQALLPSWTTFKPELQLTITAYLKSVSMKTYSGCISYLDNWINFFSSYADMCFQEPIVMYNAKTFFSTKDYRELLMQARFYKIKLLDIESSRHKSKFELENICGIDEDLCEYM